MNINFNTKWEKYRTGVLKIVQEDKFVELAPFETRDRYASSENVLLEMINKLRNRTKDTIGYINCKAGKGRSASGNAAYEFDVMERAEIRDTDNNILQEANAKTPFFLVEESWRMINDHLMYKRPVVNINEQQKPVLFSLFKKIRKDKNHIKTPHLDRKLLLSQQQNQDSDNKQQQQQQRLFLFRWASYLFAKNTQTNTVTQPTTKTPNHRSIFGWLLRFIGY